MRSPSVPVTFTSLLACGSSTDRGTERSAASWKTPSTPATAPHHVRVAQVALHQLHVEAFEVLAPSGREVVEDPHAGPAAQEALREVRADEPGPAGHEVQRACSHPRACMQRPPEPQAQTPCAV